MLIVYVFEVSNRTRSIHHSVECFRILLHYTWNLTTSSASRQYFVTSIIFRFFSSSDTDIIIKYKDRSDDNNIIIIIMIILWSILPESDKSYYYHHTRNTMYQRNMIVFLSLCLYALLSQQSTDAFTSTLPSRSSLSSRISVFDGGKGPRLVLFDSPTSEPEIDTESQSSSVVTSPSPPAEYEESAPYPIDLPSPLLLATSMVLAIVGTGTKFFSWQFSNDSHFSPHVYLSLLLFLSFNMCMGREWF